MSDTSLPQNTQTPADNLLSGMSFGDTARTQSVTPATSAADTQLSNPFAIESNVTPVNIFSSSEPTPTAIPATPAASIELGAMTLDSLGTPSPVNATPLTTLSEPAPAPTALVTPAAPVADLAQSPTLPALTLPPLEIPHEAPKTSSAASLLAAASVESADTGPVSPQQKKDKDDKKASRNSHLLNLFVVSIVLSGLVATLGYFANQYVLAGQQVVVPADEQALVTKVQSYEAQVSSYRPLNGLANYTAVSLTTLTAKQDLQRVVDATDINFIDKKDLLQTQMDGLSQGIVGEYNDLDGVKQNIAEYGFYPQELDSLFGNSDDYISIQRSLLSLEAIKFSTAMKVFSYLQTFLQQFSSESGQPINYILDRMAAYSDRGEKDINAYLLSCYLNPFELTDACNTIGDFDRYLVQEGVPDFDGGFYKELMAYMDDKLENSAYPNFAIIFNNFDPTSNNLSFRVDVNTFEQDEEELMSKGILNPHIFIVTNLVNFLKQSKYILWDGISLRDLRVTQKTIKIGGQEFTVNSSSQSFTLPLQKSTQREIFDNVTSQTDPLSTILQSTQTVATGDVLHKLVRTGGNGISMEYLSSWAVLPNEQGSIVTFVAPTKEEVSIKQETVDTTDGLTAIYKDRVAKYTDQYGTGAVRGGSIEIDGKDSYQLSITTGTTNIKEFMTIRNSTLYRIAYSFATTSTAMPEFQDMLMSLQLPEDDATSLTGATAQTRTGSVWHGLDPATLFDTGVVATGTINQ